MNLVYRVSMISVSFSRNIFCRTVKKFFAVLDSWCSSFVVYLCVLFAVQEKADKISKDLVSYTFCVSRSGMWIRIVYAA